MGITPADAGKTVSSSAVGLTDRDHPRGCGENCIVQRSRSDGQGSPPRMRGKLELDRPKPYIERITPADAGKTKSHLCTAVFREGSPPRMRGKLAVRRVHESDRGITPADAGKTPLCAPCLLRRMDHPRGCGENRYGGRTIETREGSPPRMRGKQLQHFYRVRSVRITPADAGKTHRPSNSSPHTGDHPRGCGENRNNRMHMGRAVGSPPRMRGKQSANPMNKTLHRITPADAGKTDVRITPARSASDHPRGCGENAFCVGLL